MQQRLMREREAADYIGMSAAFLRQARCYGNRMNHTPAPPHIYLGGKAVRYDRQDLDEWIEKRKEPATA